MTWIKSIFSADGEISSKRVFGGLGFVAMLVKIVMDGDMNTIIWALAISAAMLGLEAVMNALKR